MVIDDDKEIRNLLSLMLKNAGYNLITATNGSDALEYLKKSPLPALILTDYSMPQLNGYEFTEKIAAHSQYKDIPVVILTGSEIDDLELPSSSNFKGIIHKPFRLNTVLEIVKLLTSEPKKCPAAYRI
ncbi:MAG: response regulator [Peptococcaceae bacterium]|nr:response regulator [Peptococcaceae bacterium]